MVIFRSLLRRAVGILGHAKASFTEANNLMEKKDDTACGPEENERLVSLERTPICGASKGALVCLKEEHAGRHLYRPRPYVAPIRPWEVIESAEITTGLIRTPTLAIGIGTIVGVAGKQGKWRVIRIEQHVVTGDINVEVVSSSTGHSHTYRLENIRYIRSSKGVKVHA